MGKVLIQIWLKSIRQISECTKRKFEKNFQGSRKLPQVHKKVCDENERRKKRLPHKNFCGDRKDFIRLYQKNG